MAPPLVDRSTGDLIPASDHNDVKAYIEDGTYRVNTLALEIGATEVISNTRVVSNVTGNISLWTNDSNYITGNQTITLSGDVTGSGTTSIAATIANEAVTNAKLANMAANTVKVRNAGTTGVPANLAIGTNGIMGRAGSGNLASLTATNDQVLRRSGSGNLGFGTLVTNNIGNSQVTNAKLVNMAADTIKGRLSTSGDPQDLTVAQASGLLGVDDKADSANAMGSVVHGSTAGTARPTGYNVITWIGSVEPTNAENDDIWIDTN